jgi:3D (Asp-Asp-Asp) domain-containing protein
MLRLSRLSLLSLLALFLLVSCGGDDDGPADPGGDTTAPTVVSVRPDQDTTGVGPDDEIIVVFDEDMDETSAMGAVSLSPGTVTFSSWTDARTLVVTHSNWSEGMNVSVMLGVAIKDLAGNGLAAPYVWDFWTASTVPSLLRTIPLDGATSVSTGITVELLFSEAMNLTSLSAATTVETGMLRAAALPFTMTEGEGDWVNLVFDSPLPLATPIKITISTDATTASGTNLPAPEDFSFVTTADVDDTPPNLISIVPADGSVIPPGTSSIVFTFDEAIHQDLFVPSMLSGQIDVYLNYYDSPFH